MHDCLTGDKLINQGLQYKVTIASIHHQDYHWATGLDGVLIMLDRDGWLTYIFKVNWLCSRSLAIPWIPACTMLSVSTTCMVTCSHWIEYRQGHWLFSYVLIHITLMQINKNRIESSHVKSTQKTWFVNWLLL